MDISIIVPTHNRSKLLNETLKSLLALDYSKEQYEIIIVDNASTDDTRKLCKRFAENYPNMKYIYESESGLHNARHSGAKAANGDILLYIDDDIICDKNLLKEIVKFYTEPDVGCVGGKILPKWEVIPPEWMDLFHKGYLSILDDEVGPKEVQWIYGCNFSIRKKLLFELKGFNPDAFSERNMWWYRGDGEFGLLRKVQKTGKKIIYNPNAVVWHFIPKERLTVNYFKERSFKSGIEASFSKYRYFEKNISRRIIHVLRACVFGIYYVCQSMLSLISNKKQNIRKKVNSFYYKARFLYEIRLIIDKDLIKFIKKETWLD